MSDSGNVGLGLLHRVVLGAHGLKHRLAGALELIDHGSILPHLEGRHGSNVTLLRSRRVDIDVHLDELDFGVLATFRELDENGADLVAGSTPGCGKIHDDILVA